METQKTSTVGAEEQTQGHTSYDVSMEIRRFVNCVQQLSLGKTWQTLFSSNSHLLIFSRSDCELEPPPCEAEGPGCSAVDQGRAFYKTVFESMHCQLRGQKGKKLIDSCVCSNRRNEIKCKKKRKENEVSLNLGSSALNYKLWDMRPARGWMFFKECNCTYVLFIANRISRRKKKSCDSE